MHFLGTKRTLITIVLLICPAFLAAAPIDRHPELKSRTVAWTEYDGSFMVDPENRGEMLNFYWTVFAAPYPAVGWTGSINPRVAGEISEQYRIREYAQLNAYRALNRSLPMKEDASRLPMVQAGALVLALNGEKTLTHQIDPSWVGYNELAAEGIYKSELGGLHSPVRITGGSADGFIFDGGVGNAAKVGHRTQLLNDGTVGGAVGAAFNQDYGVTLWSPASAGHATDPMQFVAWPAPGHMPFELFRGPIRAPEAFRWSFVIQDGTADSKAQQNANVTAKVNGVTVPVRNLVRNVSGSPLTWDFDPAHFDLGAAPDGSEVEITVTNITGVPLGNTTVRTYTYKVTFFDPEKITPVGYSPITPLVNLSTRGTIGGGDQQMITGFSVSGVLPVRVALRTQGPGLAKYGITSPARKTRVRVYDSLGTLLGENDGWKKHQDWRLLQSFGLAPSDDNEAAMVMSLWPGNYTAVVSDDTGANGIGIVEAFNIDSESESRLANLSTRGPVGTSEQALIAGFVIKDQPRTVVIRTQGPALTRYGVTSPVSDTVLSIVSQSEGRTVATNDDWNADSRNARLSSDLAAYAPTDSREAALVLTLQPGAYTALVSAKTTAGVGLVEIFDL